MTLSRTLGATGLLLACISATACHPRRTPSVRSAMAGGIHISSTDPLRRPVTIGARLDCPEDQGDLHRTAMAADGRSCDYSSDKGEVRLALMTGDPDAALQTLKAGIDAALPRQAAGATINVISTKDADGHDVAQVDMPFIHVRDDGKRAHVRVFGFTIDADDDDRHHHRRHDDDSDGDRDRNDDADGNHTGSAMAAVGGRDYVYILGGAPASADGFHAEGYVARSSNAGKLVVASFKYRHDNTLNTSDGAHDSTHDLEALVDLNAPKGEKPETASSDSGNTSDENAAN